MIVEYIRYTAAGDRADALVEAYRQAGDLLEADEHCLSYDVARGVEHPDRVVVRIAWDSLEGHERGFRTGPHFAGFLALVGPFIDAIDEMEHYGLVEPAGDD